VFRLALGDSYATLAELRSRLGVTDAAFTAEDTKLTAALAAASRGIEKACNRQFNLASSATARIYYPDSYRKAKVDDFATTAGLVIATDEGNDGTYDTVWASTDYQLEPLNNVVDGETGWPFWWIRAVGGKTFPRVNVDSRAPLQVTAVWGWPAVPTPVKEGCLILTEDIYKLKDSPFGAGGYSQYGIIRARENPMVQKQIGSYVRDAVLVG
jgi:hypothetical protein